MLGNSDCTEGGIKEEQPADWTKGKAVFRYGPADKNVSSRGMKYSRKNVKQHIYFIGSKESVL